MVTVARLTTISSLRQIPPLTRQGRPLLTPALGPLHATTDVEEPVIKQKKEKFYGTVPGFPKLVIEYDVAPETKQEKGRFDLVAIVLLTLGMALMLSVVASLLTVGKYL